MSEEFLTINKKTRSNHAMIPSINNDTSTPKRTPEDRAQSPNYYKIRDQSCKD